MYGGYMTNTVGQVPPHFLVIVPGYMGSTLRNRKTGQIIWVDFSSIPLNPLEWGGWVDNLLQQMAYPNEDLEAASIMNEVIFVPPWAKQEHYGRLILALQAMGYKANPARYTERELTCYTFPYDWRQDNRRSAQLLAESIERWRKMHPGSKVWILAHSNGGLVARWYIEKLGGKDNVGRLLLFGSPWDGTPKMMQMLFGCVDTLFRQRFDFFNIAERSKEMIRTFPSAYQLIPAVNPFLHDVNNLTVNPYASQGWLQNTTQQGYLEDGLRFAEELGTSLSVETLCFFGRQRVTTTAGLVRIAAESRWDAIDLAVSDSGDGTIPERSAVHPNAAQKYPFNCSHGDIYVDATVLQFLKWELADQYALVSKELAASSNLIASLTTDRNTYQPGKQVTLHGRISTNNAAREPVTGAQLTVSVEWANALPGDKEPEQVPEVTTGKMASVATEPGHYFGQITAPLHDGYYRIIATVKARGESLPVQEMVAVEAE